MSQQGNPQTTLDWMRSNMRRAKDKRTDPEYTKALANIHLVESIVARYAGDLPGAIRAAEQGLIECGNVNRPIRAGILNSLSKNYRDMGDYKRAITAVQDAIHIFQERGFRVHAATGYLNLGWFLLETNRNLEAMKVFRKVREQFRDEISWVQRVYLNAGDALNMSELGRMDKALTYANQSLEQITGKGAGEHQGWALYSAGRVMKDRDKLKEAIAIWRDLKRPHWVTRTEEALNAIE